MSQAVAGEIDPVRIVDDAIEDGVSVGGIAQAFSTDAEPFTLKGATIDHNQRQDKQSYLNEAQALQLLRKVLDQYEARSGMLPARVVVHKTTMYHQEKGFRQVARDRVPACDLVWMRSTPLRLIRKGLQEPGRGTPCTVGEETYLFTSGFVRISRPAHPGSNPDWDLGRYGHTSARLRNPGAYKDELEHH